MSSVVGPDGSRMLHVDCGGSEVRCYEVLGQYCPGGYDLFWTVSRQPGRYLARCRLPARVSYPVGPVPQSGWAHETRPEDPWQRDAGAGDGSSWDGDIGY
ncbi:MAG: hypothetical protein R3B13_34845 [Polyangiaceae bacterium]